MLRTYSWGLRVSVPLFDGLRREGRVAEQRSAVRELETLRRDLERQVVLEVRLAQLDLASAAEQLGASRQRLALAEQEQEQARRRFIQGVAGNADVITALLALNAARTELVDAHAIYQSARVALAVSQSAVTQLR
jgi:outer membrane protein TolC